MKKYLLFLLLSSVISQLSSAQNVGIGTATPSSSAMLDVQSNNKGMLVPRISLTAANSALQVTSPADALLVYNTATAGTGSNAIVPGFYYWNASAARWNAMKETSISNSVGFGPWGDCSMGAISEYNPVVDETGALNDGFGNSVAISGNYAIVGAPNDDVVLNVGQGSASIYLYNGTNWLLMTKIMEATGAAGDLLGNSVSISGNYTIVGAPYDDVGTNDNQGSASFYQYNGSNWVLMNKIIDGTGTGNDYFGSTVSISGTYAIVGDNGDDVGANADEGSASIHQRVGLGWQKLQYLTDPGGNASDQFGVSTAIDGTTKRFLIGVPQ